MSGILTTELILRGFFALIVSGVLAYRIYAGPVKGERGETAIEPLLLPIITLFLGAVAVCLYGPAEGMKTMFDLFLGMIFQLAIYYLILIPLQPVMRKRLSAEACATLWTLPTLLYIILNAGFRISRPVWVFKVDGRLMHAVMLGWAAGAVLLLAKAILGHIIYRHQVLAGARPVEDPAILEIWQHEQKRQEYKKAKLKLMYSPAVSTPVAVGMFELTIRVLLPEKTYDEDELRLIFRHELIHIRRGDGRAKFFICFCRALCWFNPLMWLAMRRASEDMEMICDEAVLRYADQAERMRYADLILDAAADERGFTTCLSAKANSLRYRLKQITAPEKKLNGGLVIGLVFFVLVMSGGMTAFAYGGEKAAEVLPLADITVTNVTYYYERRDEDCAVWDTDRLIEYISGLEVYTLTGAYDPNRVYGHELFVFLEDVGGRTAVLRLIEDRLTFTWIDDINNGTGYYVGRIDWDKIEDMILVPSEERPKTPVMNVEVDGKELLNNLGPRVISITDAGGTREPGWDYDGTCVMIGEDPEHLDLQFETEPERLWVSIVPVYEQTDTIELGHVRSVDCPEYSAEYHVRGIFNSSRETTYEVEFILIIIRSEDTARYEEECAVTN